MIGYSIIIKNDVHDDVHTSIPAYKNKTNDLVGTHDATIILYTEWNQSCATGICWYYRSNGKWTLKVALKWSPYAHNLKLALYTRIGLPGASSTSNFVQLASGSAYVCATQIPLDSKNSIL